MRTINIAPVRDFLQNEIEPAALAEKLETMAWDYVGYVLRNEELCGAPEVAEDVYWIREFIQALREAI